MKDTIKAPERIYLQVCGDCTINNRETCEQCQLDNPIDPESVTWCKDRIFPNDVEYVRADVNFDGASGFVATVRCTGCGISVFAFGSDIRSALIMARSYWEKGVCDA